MRTALIVLVIAAVLTATGCGDDAKPLSSAELTVKANNICAKVDLALRLAVTPAKMDAFGEASDQGIKDLKKLVPPKERKAAYDAYVKAQEAVVQADKPYLAALKKGDEATENKLAPAVMKTDAASDAAAAKAGLIKCGDPKNKKQ
jgi:hypothetical protein